MAVKDPGRSVVLAAARKPAQTKSAVWSTRMQEPVVVSLNEEALTERIVQASERVCFVSPGIYDWVAEALVEVAGRIGCERVYVIVDPDPFAIQVGYGTEEAIRKVYASGVLVRRAER